MKFGDVLKWRKIIRTCTGSSWEFPDRVRVSDLNKSRNYSKIKSQSSMTAVKLVWEHLFYMSSFAYKWYFYQTLCFNPEILADGKIIRLNFVKVFVITLAFFHLTWHRSLHKHFFVRCFSETNIFPKIINGITTEPEHVGKCLN